jgi:hypothetical protein
VSPQSRLVAGVLLILMPAVVYGGASILSLLIGDPAYAQNASDKTSGGRDTPTQASCSCSPWSPCDTWTRRSCRTA